MAGQGPVFAGILQRQADQKANRKAFAALKDMAQDSDSDFDLGSDSDAEPDGPLHEQSSDMVILPGSSSARKSSRAGSAQKRSRGQGKKSDSGTASTAVVPAKRGSLAASWRPGKRVSAAVKQNVADMVPGAKRARALRDIDVNSASAGPQPYQQKQQQWQQQQQWQLWQQQQQQQQWQMQMQQQPLTWQPAYAGSAMPAWPGQMPPSYAQSGMPPAGMMAGPQATAQPFPYWGAQPGAVHAPQQQGWHSSSMPSSMPPQHAAHGYEGH